MYLNSIDAPRDPQYTAIHIFALHNEDGYREVHVHYQAGGGEYVTMAEGNAGPGRALAPAGLAAAAGRVSRARFP